MYTHLMTRCLAVLCIVVTTNAAQARTWRVNTDATKSPDFTTINAAVAAASDGDTLLIEPSPTAYAAFTLNKRLVILGNGYFLSGNNLQSDKDSSAVLSIFIDSSATTANGSGSYISGLTLSSGAVLRSVSNVTITRCHIVGQVSFSTYSRAAGGIVFSQNFIEAAQAQTAITAQVNVTFENNIYSTASGTGFLGPILDNNFTGIFRNNTMNIAGPSINLSNFYIANNIFTNAATNTITGTNNVFRNNSFAAAAITGVTDGVDGNHTSVNVTGLFAGDIANGYGDTRFQTAGPGILRGTGETIGGITPDRGAYNTVATTDTYHSSGIPPIPAVYKLAVPASVSSSATTINITVSTRSNN